jgi:uncharacterized damage-inducible protein DinB
MSADATTFDPTALLLDQLQQARANLIVNLEGLDEYDVRRPMTPSGTNLLGLVKHVATMELGYLGTCTGRPLDVQLPWDTEGIYTTGADMYALRTESRDWVLGLYRRSWEHADENVRALGLAAPAEVPWWSRGRRQTSVGHLLIHMIDETSQHAGQADVVRESIDGRAGADHDDFGDAERWREYVAEIQAEADHFRPPR